MLEIQILFKPEDDSLEALDQFDELSSTLRGLNVSLVCLYQPGVARWAKAQYQKFYPHFLKRVVVRCTEDQYRSEDANAFASGVIWERLPG